MSLHPYAEGNIAAARRDIAKCVTALRAACAAKDSEAWKRIGEALGHATQVAAQLEDAMTLEEMTEEAANGVE